MGQSDSFVVDVEIEIGTQTVTVSASGGVGFNKSCADKSHFKTIVADDATGEHPNAFSLTLHACSTPSGTVTASVDTVSDSQTVTVRMPDSTPSLPSVSSKSGTVGTALNIQLPAATGGDPPLSYTASPLPSGLNFDGGHLFRRITGTPRTEGTTTVTYTVTDEDTVNPDSDSTTFTFTINPEPTVDKVAYLSIN